MFLRLIKVIIRSNRQIEDAKQALFSHKTFSLEDSFKLFDLNQNGKLSVNEFTQVFSDHNIDLRDIGRLVELIDTDEDGTVEFNEWTAAFKPKRPCRGADPCYNLGLEQRNLFQRAWLEQLGALCCLII